MKKNILAVVMALGMGASAGFVVAAPAAFQNNVNVEQAQCALLSETVRLGVSAKVHGAYNCDEEENLVQVAACHEGGSRQQGVACVPTDPNDPDSPLPAGCGGNPTPSNSNIPDYKAFFTSSQGGVMQEQQLGARCSSGTITGISGFSN